MGAGQAQESLLLRQVRRVVSYVNWDGSEPTARGTLADLLDDSGHPGTPPESTSGQALRT
jgi:hypothetical protein